MEIVVITELSGRAHASIRPEDIIISRDVIRSSARNSLRGRIVEIADRGAVVYVTVRIVPGPARGGPGATAPDFIAMITRRSLEEMELREGLDVHIAFKSSAVHVF